MVLWTLYFHFKHMFKNIDVGKEAAFTVFLLILIAYLWYSLESISRNRMSQIKSNLLSLTMNAMLQEICIIGLEDYTISIKPTITNNY